MTSFNQSHFGAKTHTGATHVKNPVGRRNGDENTLLHTHPCNLNSPPEKIDLG